MCVCETVCEQNISKNIDSINFIFGGGLPSDPRRKPFDFDKNRPGVRVRVCVCVCGGGSGGGGSSKFGPNDKR